MTACKAAAMTKTAETASELIHMLVSAREPITNQWLGIVSASSRGRTNAAETKHDLKPIADAFFSALESGTTDANSPAFAEVRAFLSEYAGTRARQGFSPSETAEAIFALRDAMFSFSQRADFRLESYLPLSKLVDALGLVTIETYAQTREAVVTSQAEQLLELSTPVTKLWEGVLAVPLVGTLDSARTQVVMESLLDMLVATGSSYAIIDITGVPAVDTQVAQHLLKTIAAARLMGAECVISGIRPQIAQTVVALGVEFGDIVTKATLADALRLILSRAGFEIKKVR